MSKYSIKQLNIPLVPIDPRDKLSNEEKSIREQKYLLLREYGVYVARYTDGNIECINHPDGIHNYRQDAHLAMQLVLKENKELPDDLKERLLYYKNIMEKEE